MDLRTLSVMSDCIGSWVTDVRYGIPTNWIYKLIELLMNDLIMILELYLTILIHSIKHRRI